MGVVSLIDKGAVVLDEFLYRRPEAAGKRGEDGFVDDPLLGGVIGIIINRDQVIEGFESLASALAELRLSQLWRKVSQVCMEAKCRSASCSRVQKASPSHDIEILITLPHG